MVAKYWSQYAAVTLFVPSRTAQLFCGLSPGVEIRGLPDASIRSKLGRLLVRGLLSLTALRSLRDFDILCATGNWLPDMVPAAASKLLWRTPFVSYIHHITNTGPVPLLADRTGIGIARPFCSRFLTCDPTVAQRLTGWGVPSGKIALTRYGFAESLTQSDPAQRIPNHALFVGRIHETKRAFDLPRIWSRVRERIPEAALSIVGAGTPADIARLQHEIEREGGASVRYLGSLPEADLVPLRASADIFLFPSSLEGWGLAIGEAMATGLPCVTYELPVFARAFPQGRVSVPVDDWPALADAAAALLKDHERKEALRAEAIELASRNLWRDLAREQFQELQRCL